MQLTGEVGTGKTTLSRLLLEQIPENTRVALVLNPRVSAIELLETICEELHVDVGDRRGSVKALIDALNAEGVDVAAYDPLLEPDEIEALGARPWRWGEAAPFRAVITQTADSLFGTLDPVWFPSLELVYDGRNSLRSLALPDDVAYIGVGVQAATRAPAG